MPFSKAKKGIFVDERQKNSKAVLTSSFFKMAERLSYTKEKEQEIFSEIRSYLLSGGKNYREMAKKIKAIYEAVKSNPELWKKIKKRILEAMLFFLRRNRIKIEVREETKKEVRSKIIFFVEKLEEYLQINKSKDAKALRYLLSEFFGSFSEDFLGSRNLRFVNFDLGWVFYYNLKIFLDHINEDLTDSLRVTDGIYFPQHKKFFVFHDSPTFLLHEYMHLLLYTMFGNYSREVILKKVYLPFIKYLKKEVSDLAYLIPEGKANWVFLNEFITDYLTYILYYKKDNEIILLNNPKQIKIQYYSARLFASKTAKDADRHLEHFFDLCSNLP